MPRPGGATAFANTATGTTDGTLTMENGATLAAPSNKQRIAVLSVAMVCGGTATSVTFNSKGGGAGTAISPLFANAANGGAVLPYSAVGWFSTNPGETLTVTTTAAGSTTGIIVVYKVI